MQNKVSEMLGYFHQIIELTNVSLSEEQIALFGRYYEILLEYNQRINLTRIIEPKDVAVKHFWDSIAVLDAKVFLPSCSVMDVGTGAGFPGIPIAILRRDIHVTLVDSLRKRTDFLSEAIQLLGLDNVSVVWARAEEIGRSPLHREKYDVVLARAVAALNILVEYCIPLVKNGGSFLAMKGPKAEEELEQAKGALTKLGGSLYSTRTESLPLVGEGRTLIRVTKTRTTSTIYPRKAGVPERQPLT